MLYPQPPKGGALKINKQKHQIFFTPGIYHALAWGHGVNEENQLELLSLYNQIQNNVL